MSTIVKKTISLSKEDFDYAHAEARKEVEFPTDRPNVSRWFQKLVRERRAKTMKGKKIAA